MMIGAFISFMVLGRSISDFLIYNTLFLGACGIFDLFWWSILADMLDYSSSPSLIFGLGLSANVFGVLLGNGLGIRVTHLKLSIPQLAVIGLVVISLTLIMLPLLNRHLVLLLKSHDFLASYDSFTTLNNEIISPNIESLDSLTKREEEVLQMLLQGASNRKIAKELFISESTVKTHVRNILSKFNVSSRVELLSLVLKSHST